MIVLLKCKWHTDRQLAYEDMRDVSLLQYLMDETDSSESFSRAILNNLGLNEALDCSCNVLSGGKERNYR